MVNRAIELLMSGVLSEEDENKLQDFVNSPATYDKEDVINFFTEIENNCITRR
jgi:hypothetical protein